MRVCCKVCGVEFNVRPAEVKRGRGKYCSHECSARANNPLGIKTVVKNIDMEKELNEQLYGRGSPNPIISSEPEHSFAEYEPTEEDLFRLKVIRLRKRGIKTYEYDDCGEAIGEYDCNGNLVRY